MSSPSPSFEDIRATIILESLRCAACPLKKAAFQIEIFNRLSELYGRDVAETFFLYNQACMSANPSQPINISIVNSTIGNFVLDSQIQSITSSVNAVAQHGISGAEFASAVKQIVEAVMSTKELSDETKKEIVDSFEVIAEQAALPAEKRRIAIVKPVLEAVPKLLSSVNSLVTLWHSIGPQVTAWF